MNIHNTICNAANSYRTDKMKSAMPTQAEFEEVLTLNNQREQTMENLTTAVDELGEQLLNFVSGSGDHDAAKKVLGKCINLLEQAA